MLQLVKLLPILSLVVQARKWRDTGGSIVFEEAWTIPELLPQIGSPLGAIGGTAAELKANLLDVHDQRLTLMDENDIDFMVISCAQPCIQGISDPVAAAEMAVTVNDRLAGLISNNTARFGGFASLAMHNATVAAQELERAVTKLGFLGALINDYQQSGADNATLLFFDSPAYDVFWKKVIELDVPVYFHPRTNIDQILSLLYAHSVFLEGAAQEFAVTLSTHVLGLCTNGVFDRFPGLKIIVGHLGERIPSDLVRIDEQLIRTKPIGLPMLKNASEYWNTNLFETTAGNFATPLLKFHMSQFGGIDRILFSIDYPYANIPEGAAWLETLRGELSKKDFNSLKRNRAIELLHLND